MSGKRTIGWRVRLKGGDYIHRDGRSFALWEHKSNAEPLANARELKARAERFRAREWCSWSTFDIRLVRVVVKGGGK